MKTSEFLCDFDFVFTTIYKQWEPDKLKFLAAVHLRKEKLNKFVFKKLTSQLLFILVALICLLFKKLQWKHLNSSVFTNNNEYRVPDKLKFWLQSIWLLLQ